MSYLLIAPELLSSAAADVDGIAAAIQAANATAAGQTSGLLAAAGDEVSAAIAGLFSSYGQDYQVVVRQAAAYQAGFNRTLAAAAGAYAQAEAAGAALVQSLLGRPGAAPGSIAASGGAGTLFAPQAALVATPLTALIMGGTGNPLPLVEYVLDINAGYIQPRWPGANFQGFFTPEQFWPVTNQLGTLTYTESVARGTGLIMTEINRQFSLFPGQDVVVFGYSQSASIVHNTIVNLMAAGSPHADSLAFIMAGAGNNPNGGLLSRFPGFYLPGIDVLFNGATPANNPYETYVYTAQYDGIAHVPQYPTNILADINALMGYFYVHGNYPTLSPSDAVLLPTSPGYTGNTEYYMYLTQNLPILQPIRDIPYAGPVIADLLQPPLRVMIDLGYADGYADLPTPAGLINIPNPLTFAYYMGQGLMQAPYGAAVQIGVQAGLLGPEYFPDAYPWVPMVNPGLNMYFGPALSQPPVTLLSLLSGGLGDVLDIIPPVFN